MRSVAVTVYVLLVGYLAVSPNGPPYVPSTIEDFELPGSQPDPGRDFILPTTCDNCHGGYDAAVEPNFNWSGSMMAQAGRDPIFLASLVIANQDAPESGDLCIRCHFPSGWLEGRSKPTDGSALLANDRIGVFCQFCHKLVAPTPIGTNPYPTDSDYTANTYSVDQAFLADVDDIPTESSHGSYLVDEGDDRRGPYTETAAPHNTLPSPFHRESALCGTCHDVSNPVFSLSATGQYVPNTFGEAAPSVVSDSLFPVERTYSEWLASAYNSPSGVYAPQFGGNKDYVATCQDCHMRDVTGKGASKGNAPVRTDLPLHDMTGGNTFAPKLINLAYPGEANQSALDSAVVRARYMLQEAASMELDVVQEADSFRAHVKITNETGHKLPSGYPEGRRTWINLRAFNESGTLIYESGAYNPATASLTKDADVKVYEIKPGLSPGLASALGLAAGPSFHFVLNDTIYSDNRIPPRGFTNAGFAAIGSPVVGYTYADGQYWDDTYYGLPAETRKVIATMYYQTASKDFIEFLRDENVTDDMGDSLFTWWSANGKSLPELMQIDSATVAPVGLNLDLKVFLEGAYTGTDSMSVSPAFAAAVPTSQPFSDPLFDGTDLENDTTLSVSTWQPDFVQWALVSFRTDSAGATEVFTTPAIVKDDGSVVDTSGTGFLVPGIAPASYFVVVRERNHLPVMSMSAVDFSSGSGVWDFTTGLSTAHTSSGQAMKVLPDGRTAMVAGDASMDGQVTVSDFNVWLVDTKAVATGYLQSDLNFDAQSTVSDFNLWLVNTKAVFGSQVPD